MRMNQGESLAHEIAREDANPLEELDRAAIAEIGGDWFPERYQALIRQYPRLSTWQERNLARRAVRGDDCARECLVFSNLPWIIGLAERFRLTGLDLGDLVQEGLLTLLEQLTTFAPELGARLKSYAKRHVWRSMVKLVARLGYPVRIPIAETSRRVAVDRGRTRDKLVLAEAIPGTRSTLAVSSNALRIGNPLLNRKDIPLEARTVPSHEDAVLNRLWQQGLDEALARAALWLQPREKEALFLQFGFFDPYALYVASADGVSDLTYETTRSTAKFLMTYWGISAARVSQIRRRVLTELRCGIAGFWLAPYRPESAGPYAGPRVWQWDPTWPSYTRVDELPGGTAALAVSRDVLLYARAPQPGGAWLVADQIAQAEAFLCKYDVQLGVSPLPRIHAPNRGVFVDIDQTHPGMTEAPGLRELLAYTREHPRLPEHPGFVLMQSPEVLYEPAPFHLQRATREVIPAGARGLAPTYRPRIEALCSLELYYLQFDQITVPMRENGWQPVFVDPWGKVQAPRWAPERVPHWTDERWRRTATTHDENDEFEESTGGDLP